MKSFRRTAAAATLLAPLLVLPICAQTHADSFTKEGLLKANVANLKDTEIVAQPDVPLDPGKNVLWCGTLQLAWNKAIDLVGEKLRFTTPSPIADLLNREDFTEADLNPDSYVAIADFEKNNVEDEIRAALEKTFHGAASPELIPPKPSNPGPDDFVAYAYLYKDLAFAHPFSDNDPLVFAGQPVKNFGLSHADKLSDAVFRQVEIFDYQSADNFIVELKTKAAGDQLILAKIPPGATLQATIDAVLQRMTPDKMEITSHSDSLAVPKLNFDLKKEFDDLQGLILDPSPAAKIKQKLRIEKAEQLVRFQLNEKGAVLKSEAVIVMRALAMMPRHSMIFDQPFLVMMKEASSTKPYFALWVGNATLLVPAK
jgi:hypothetical protein